MIATLGSLCLPHSPDLYQQPQNRPEMKGGPLPLGWLPKFVSF